MEQGVTKWFDSKKGYGFITPDNGGEELFLHFSAIQGDGFKVVKDGDRVQYEAARNEKGVYAKNVTKI